MHDRLPQAVLLMCASASAFNSVGPTLPSMGFECVPLRGLNVGLNVCFQ